MQKPKKKKKEGSGRPRGRPRGSKNKINKNYDFRNLDNYEELNKERNYNTELKINNDEQRKTEYDGFNRYGTSGHFILRRQNKLNDILLSKGFKSKNNDKKDIFKHPKQRSVQNYNLLDKKKNNIWKSISDDNFYYHNENFDEKDAINNKQKKLILLAKMNSGINNTIKEVDKESDSYYNDDYDHQQRQPFESKIMNKKQQDFKNQVLNGIDNPNIKNFFSDETYLELSSTNSEEFYKNSLNNSFQDYGEKNFHNVTNINKPYSSKSLNKKINDMNYVSFKNRRRSSYFNRGKRVLSIGNGFMGEPHRDVSATSYFKLLDTSIPEPDRMRQLLIWCFKNKLNQEETEIRKIETSTEDQTIINIAKVIKEEVIHDLMEKKIPISWYNRSTANDKELLEKEIKVLNPLNILNKENIEKYMIALNKITNQKHQWNDSYNLSVHYVRNLLDNDLFVHFIEHKSLNFEEYIKEKNISKIPVFYSVKIMKNTMTDELKLIYNNLYDEALLNLFPILSKLFFLIYFIQRSCIIVKKIHKEQFSDKLEVILNNFMKRNNNFFFFSSKYKNTYYSGSKYSTLSNLLRGLFKILNFQKKVV